MKRLIVSADDFGMSPAVNAGIIRAHREGILTQASLMVNGAAADDAIRLARENPTLRVGLHLVLVQGYPVTPAGEVPILAGADGMFRRNPVWNGIRYFFAPGARAQLRNEIRAQLQRFLDSGLDLSHVDGHLTVHMHPAALEILMELAEQYGIRAMRLPNDPYRQALRFDPQHFLRKSFEAGVFTAISRWARKKLDAAGIAYADRVHGMHQTGHVTEAYLLDLLATLPDGTTEIYCHAGTWDDEARRWRPPDYDPEGELAALMSARVKSVIQERGIELVGYAALASRSRIHG